MLISVLIPMEFHRDQGAMAIGKWRGEQTLDGKLFEVIVIASRRTRERDLAEIRALLGPDDRLILTDATHDMAQVAEAATHARAEILFFTESHVLPTPEVLTQCVETFEQHPEWAAFSCRTEAITANRQARAEARMYEADILYGMTEHPWRKILDQCFVTRRAAYEAAGGFDGALGHFAEFVLAARYATLGFTIGYAPEIRLSHYYLGHVGTLHEFTADFVAGETAYWERGQAGRMESLMEPPIEWWTRGNRRRDLAAHLVRIAREHHLACGGIGFTEDDLKDVSRRHRPAALAGSAVERSRAQIDLLRARLRLEWRRLFGPEAHLDSALQDFTSAAARAGRLAPVRSLNSATHPGVLWTPGADDAHRGCGFYAGEIFDGIPFRWSEEVAVIELPIPIGRHQLRLETLFERFTTATITPAFYFNGRRIDDEKIKRAGGDFIFKVKRGRKDPALLSWVTERQPAPGDARHLGVPVAQISSTPVLEKEKLKQSVA